MNVDPAPSKLGGIVGTAGGGGTVNTKAPDSFTEALKDAPTAAEKLAVGAKKKKRRRRA